MNRKNLTLKDLFDDDWKFSIIAGAGCSQDAPSNLPNSNKLMEEIINFTLCKFRN